MIELRAFRESDAEDLLNLFRDTIRTINRQHYDEPQVRAWASDDIDLQKWSERFNDRCALVAEIDGVIVGFADMDSEGYLDRLFVAANQQRKGIASALLNAIRMQAKKLHLRQIWTESSITAKPFFEHHGFRIEREQLVECRAQRLTNFRMTLSLEED